MRFLLILIALPMIEIALFIQVGAWIGLWPTLGLVLLAAAAGLTVMRVQGLQAVQRLRRTVESGGDPGGSIAHGALILIAGVLLLIPGFFTDFLGLPLLLPPVRGWLIARGAARMTARAATFRRTDAAGPRPPPEIIDAEFEVLDEDAPKRPSGKSGWTRPGP